MDTFPHIFGRKLNLLLLCTIHCSMNGSDNTPPTLLQQDYSIQDSKKEKTHRIPTIKSSSTSHTPDASTSVQSPDMSIPVKTLYLHPLGDQLDGRAISLVETAIQEFYGFKVVTNPPRPLPSSAYYPPRKRYRAEKLLEHLRQSVPYEAFRVLGITAVDISTTKDHIEDWGIMGLATLDGQVAVMSMFRCQRGSISVEHAHERFGKVAVHEIGHTLGLRHCPTHGCLMEDARGTNRTTDREYVLCPRCRQFLQDQGYRLPSNPTPPWRQP